MFIYGLIKFKLDPPAPLKLPLIGNLYKLVFYVNNPWEGFDFLRKNYGDIVSLRLGEYNFVLLSSLKLIHNVLIINGDQFAHRPHFERYKCIFGGDQENGKI